MTTMPTFAVVDDFDYECICTGPPDVGQRHSTGCAVGNAARAEQYAREHGVYPIMATLPDQPDDWWKRLKAALPEKGEPGISYTRMDPGPAWGGGEGRQIDVLMHRNHKGRLTGVLHYYQHEFGKPGHAVYARAGSVSLWVAPNRRGRGVGEALVREGLRRWPDGDLSRSEYTKGGLKMARLAQSIRDSERPPSSA